MLQTERDYIYKMVKHAAAVAIEYSPLNVDRAAREFHTARLTDDFMTTIEVYLSENETHAEDGQPTE